MICTSLILGLHLYTAHVRSDLNNVNPGVYAECDRVVLGTYYNSVKKNSTYVGYRWNVTDRISFMAVGVTGYSELVRLGIVPSYKFDSGVRVNLLLPSSRTAKGGISFSLEF